MKKNLFFVAELIYLSLTRGIMRITVWFLFFSFFFVLASFLADRALARGSCSQIKQSNQQTALGTCSDRRMAICSYNFQLKKWTCTKQGNSKASKDFDLVKALDKACGCGYIQMTY